MIWPVVAWRRDGASSKALPRCDPWLDFLSTITSTSTTLRPPKKFSSPRLSLLILSYFLFLISILNPRESNGPRPKHRANQRSILHKTLLIPACFLRRRYPDPRPAISPFCPPSLALGQPLSLMDRLLCGRLCLSQATTVPEPGFVFKFQTCQIRFKFQHLNISTLDRAIEHLLSGCIARRLLLFSTYSPKYATRATTV